MRIPLAWMAAALVAPQIPVHAQDRPVPATYKVEFNIRDGSDVAKTGRHYTLLVEPNRKAVFKVGSRVPTISGSFQPASNTLVNTQYTYLDIGVNIECIIAENNGRIEMHGSMDLSGIAPVDGAVRGSGMPNPSIVQTKLDLDTSVTLGRPTVIASIDDPVTARQVQVEATVARAN